MPVIEGLRYRSCSDVEGCLEGGTSASGAFQRIRERPVQLRVGDVVVFESTAAALAKTADFSSTADEHDPVFVNKMALLYSLDADGDPGNGIQLSAYAHAALTLPPGTQLDFTSDFATFRQDPVAVSVVASATLGDLGVVMPPLDPLQVQETIRQEMFRGYYAGGWDLQFDDASGTLAYTVHANGSVDAPNEPGAFAVTPTSASELLFRRVALTGRTINGHLYANGTGFGTWLDSGGASGRWSATRQAH
jgi:hypothetical protein